MRPSPAEPSTDTGAAGPAADRPEPMPVDTGPPRDLPPPGGAPQPLEPPPQRPITPPPPPAPPVQWAWPRIPPVMAGPAIGALIAGIAALPVSVAVVIAVAADAAVVAIAFMVLAVYLGGGAAGLATVANRQIRAGRGEYTGRGAGVAGMICGCVAVGMSVLLAVLVSVAG